MKKKKTSHFASQVAVNTGRPTSPDPSPTRGARHREITDARSNSDRPSRTRRSATADAPSRIKSAAELPAMFEELQAHRLELLTQNEALRRSCAEAEAARDALFDLFEFAPFCYLALDSDWRIVHCNQAACRFLGYSRSGMVGRRFHQLLDPADACNFSLFCRRLIAGSSPEKCRIRLLHETGVPVPTEIEANALFRRADDRRRLLLCLTDFSHCQKEMDNLERSRAQWRELAQRLQVVIEEERTNVASQVFSDFEPTLGRIKTELAEMERQLTKADHQRSMADVMARIQSLRQPVIGALHRVRKIARGLRPPVLDALGLVAAVETCAAEVRAESHLDCQLNLPKNEMGIAPDLATALYRIFCEAISDIVRHAQATRVLVRLARESGNWILQIADDGPLPPGSKPSGPRGVSVLAMRARMEPFGGRVDIAPAPQRGTILTVSVPHSSH